MGQVTLNAEVRKTRGKVRDPRFIQGVVYGHNVESTAVKFEEKDIRQAISTNGPNAKVWISQGNEGKKFGFIKEIQRHIIKDQIIHVDVQLVGKDQEINIQIPIIFKGHEQLGSKGLRLQINKSDVDALGKMLDMPDVLEVDVSDKELNDTITINHFNLPDDIKINDAIDEPYASIVHLERITGDDLESENIDEMPEPAVIGEE